MAPLRYTSFTKQVAVIKHRLSSLATQVDTLAKNETALSKSDKVKIQVINDEVVRKNADFSVLLDRLFTSDTSEDSEKDALDPAEISKCQEEISDLYIQIHSQCAALIDISEPPKHESSTISNSGSSSNSCSNESSYVRLPTLNLGVFSGQADKWIAFHSLFESTVHTNSKLSQVEKFTYLLSCLASEPLNMIKSLPITAENYTIAYDQLVKRYNNKRLLISLHVNNIMDLSSMNHSSVKQLRQFLSTFQENSSALRALDYDISKESIFITSFLLRKFDHDFRSKFERSRDDCKEMPTLAELVEFIETECIQLEAANLTQSNSQSQPFSSKSKPDQFHSKNAYKQKTALLVSGQNCKFCSANDHSIYKCNNFTQMSVDERHKFVKENSLCNNCLGKHNVRNCKSTHSCQTCHRRHHSLLHFGNQSSSSSTPKASSSDSNQTNQIPSQQVQSTQPAAVTSKPKKEPSSSTSVLVGLSHSNTNIVLLGTTLVQLTSANGKTLVVRAVLDSAAQQSFITDSCARKLGLSRSHVSNHQILGISSAAVSTKGECCVSISSLNGHVVADNHFVTVLDKITNNLPCCEISSEVKERMPNLMLADPTFDKPAPIDALIGADLFALTLCGNIINLGSDMPSAIETIFGYVLIGSTPVHSSLEETYRPTNLLTVSNFDLHNAVQKFWAEENLPSAPKLSPDEERCESHFLQTHSRLEDGKYQVRLPFKDPPDQLGESAKHALCVFKSLENRLQQNPTIKQKYADFMSDYENAGHMIPISSLPPTNCFLPHHFVMREEKIRVVFNASAKTSTGLTLNSILHAGPKLHNDIPTVLLGFRRFKFVFTCDIQQMFRNIWIHPDDQHFQLIYWRSDPHKPLQIFKLQTVTYGMAPSPYLANRVIQQLIEDEGSHHPLAAAALKGQIYVDDALLGADSLEQCILLQDDTIQLMRRGGFKLSKWLSNHPKLLEGIPANHRGTPLQFDSPDQPIARVLGLKWSPETDSFSFLVNHSPTKITKRTVLSDIARLYDPIGWLTPTVFWAKAFMQIMWTKGLQWDDPLPSDLSSAWESFVLQLPLLENISIPRHIDTISSTNLQLHGFSDASEAGYCALVYLRVQKDDNTVQTYLLIAKSRVAPLKKVSLPRLELCGAHLLSKLLLHCVTELSYLTLDQVYAWCDSTITLSWIQTPAYRLKTYVANRVAEIQDIKTPLTWLHIASEQNPADCGSRGLMPSALIAHPLWWTGPGWLKTSPLQLPSSSCTTLPEDSLPEVKAVLPAALHVVETHPTNDLLTRFSSWSKLIHVVAYMQRFINNCKQKMSTTDTSCNEENLPRLSPKELVQATQKVISLVQFEAFPNDIISLNKSQPLSPSLQRLSPFMDNNLIRVGGRLKNSEISYEAKHPLLLPKKHHVTNLIIDYYHKIYLHCGPQQLQSLIGLNFWILSARSIIRSRIFKCLTCQKCKPKLLTPKMSDLPKSRVIASKRPFVSSAVDYAGPFLVKLHVNRRTQPVKVYLCLFICLTTKAVHLEMATDLTSAAFLACLTRFVSRRGLISELFSDNGTNFTAAAKELKDTFQKLAKQTPTQEYLLANRITFHFSPPHAPHFGGLWERSVKSSKYHLRRVIGSQILTLEEFSTLLCKVEAILNSRPITAMSSDPNDFEALTPGHFLIGGPLVSLPEPDYTEISSNRLKRWQLVTSFNQHIWNRWYKEYLHSLQHRPKWTQTQRNLEKNDLVLIHQDNVPPMKWRMGRISKILPGKDNVVRVVEITTSSGIITRPVVKLSLLSFDE